MMKLLRESRVVGNGVIIIALLLLVYQVTVLPAYTWNRSDLYRDIYAYYTAGQHVARHQPIYDPPAHFVPAICPKWYVYPPQLALLFALLSRFTYVQVFHIWYPVEIAAYWGFAAVLGSITTGRWSLKGTAAWGLPLWFMPGMEEQLTSENVDAVLWLLYGLGFVLPARGLLWALVCQVKPFTAPALLVACVVEKRSVWLPALLTTLVGWGLAVVIAGPGAVGQWLPAAKQIGSQGTSNHGNASLSFAVLRMASGLGWIDFRQPLPTMARLWLAVAPVVAILTTVVLTRRGKPGGRYATITAATILSSPICWINYLPLLLVIPALSLRRMTEAKAPEETVADREEQLLSLSV